MTQFDATPEERIIAPIMFWASLSFLALVATLLVLWIYVPTGVEAGLEAAGDDAELAAAIVTEFGPHDAEFERAAYAYGWGVLMVLLAIWPLFWLEQAYNFFKTGGGDAFASQHPYWWAACIAPPLRLCSQKRGAVSHVWLPRLGWQPIDRPLRKRLEKAFSVPMIFIALLILPVLGLEFYFQDRIMDYPALRIALLCSAGLIWFAFALEFIVMVSVTDRKFDYCRRHWLDLAIICLPLISFLRSLRAIKAAKFVKVSKLQQLARIVRVYRLRGVAMRAVRALLLLEVIHRLLPSSPEKRIARLQWQYDEKLRELEELREEIDALTARVNESSQPQSSKTVV